MGGFSWCGGGELLVLWNWIWSFDVRGAGDDGWVGYVRGVHGLGFFAQCIGVGRGIHDRCL